MELIQIDKDVKKILVLGSLRRTGPECSNKPEANVSDHTLSPLHSEG